MLYSFRRIGETPQEQRLGFNSQLRSGGPASLSWHPSQLITGVRLAPAYGRPEGAVAEFPHLTT